MNIMEILEPLIIHLPALVIAVPLLAAFLTPLISRINDKLRNAFAIIMLSINAFFVFLLSYDVFTNGTRVYVFGADTQQTLAAIQQGVPMVRILFEIDGLSAFMAIVAAILPLAAVFYAWGFMKEHTGLDKFYTLILLMSTGMLGMVLTGDMFNFFVFLEITSISSAALVAFYTNKGPSVLAGFKYIVISTIGALFVLFAVALLYGQYNALNIAVLANNIQFGFIDKIALILLVVALAMKSGVVPMHMWLPDAYGRAPAAVTLVLIGTTQASLYGLFRVCFTLYGNQLKSAMKTIEMFGNTIQMNISSLVGVFLIALAIVTILIGVLMALKQNDFKRMIGYAAVAEIGYMLLAFGAALSTLVEDPVSKIPLLSVHGDMALKGSLFHIINDALDVGLMFLVAGAVYYATKETSLNKLGGLARNMKYTSIFFIIALLAVSGMPPMNGFASKLLIYESTYAINPILAIVAILCSILLLAVFVKVFHSVFLGPKMKKFENVKEVPKSMLIGMGIIAFFIIFFGLFPDLIVTNIIQPAVNAMMNLSGEGGYISTILGGGL